MIIGHRSNWAKDRAFAHPVLQQAIDYLTTTDFGKLEAGAYPLQDDDMVAIVMERSTRPGAEQPAEKHEQFLDIHYLLEGDETIGWAAGREDLIPTRPYETGDDTALYGDIPGELPVRLTPGTYVVLFPEDIHRPLLADRPAPVRKVVMKLHTRLF
ncbi:hypothetical protein J31TS4_34510 [Paenibacillus sp. J31TS4]|uniref:YhcH/YjgK/YiaL family protein n=1 Tax=Paenibacillus sp. J31TS4 TaxID=2807195 RepID=UPI001B106CF2|nr:YhcH/YjgK/YiaL family protein [Paenibacillus sp. J31TS4]GIP40171.1 hypothetical protein J31TS4_34510 [Paenibacillus sp. J31TS4]